MDLFRTRSLPFLCRHNYYVEMRHFLCFGVFAGMVEGGVCAVVAAKTFHASNLLITLVSATPMFANLVSLAWGVLSRGRRKLALLTALAGAAVACTASIGATPATPLGGWIFAAQIALARIFVSGVVTLRTALWRSNYPQHIRGMITARLQGLRSAMGLIAVTGAGLVFDRDADAFRWVYPLTAAFGAAGALLIIPMRVRGERLALRQLREHDRAPDAAQRPARAAPFDVVALPSPGHMLSEMGRVLRDDRLFARYCAAQMSLGFANIMIHPILPIIFTRRLDLSYLGGSGLLDVLPQLLVLLALPYWGRLFDRVGVIRMRVVNVGAWLLMMLIAAAAGYVVSGDRLLSGGAFLGGVLLFVLSRAVYGVSVAGGNIAWYIGHLAFADERDAELYMGVHVSLTGLRGLVAPFVGLWLYTWADWWVFVAAAALLLIGMVQFHLLAPDVEARQKPATRA